MVDLQQQAVALGGAVPEPGRYEVVSLLGFSLTCISRVGEQGMVEVVAENYHNIWAKKKKLELESKGELIHSAPWGAWQLGFPRGTKEDSCVSLSPYSRWWQSPSLGTI